MLCSFVSLGAISSKLVPIGEHHGILSGKTFQELCESRRPLRVIFHAGPNPNPLRALGRPGLRTGSQKLSVPTQAPPSPRGKLQKRHDVKRKNKVSSENVPSWL